MASARGLGGDVVRSERVVLGVTALGDLGGRDPVTASGARPGDVVAVAGRLGWAAAGLAVLARGFRIAADPRGGAPPAAAAVRAGPRRRPARARPR